MASIAKLGRLNPSSSALFVCDIQEKFRPVISGYPAVIDTAKRMIRGAETLGLPVLATEQYPKALGVTVSELKEVLPASSLTLAKTKFSMLTPAAMDWLKQRPEVDQVLLLGIEAHVCVLQTSMDLISNGYEVHLLVDGISSQRPLDRAVALQRMAHAGALLSSSEMALFQLMGDATHPQFKIISALSREPRPDTLPMLSML